MVHSVGYLRRLGYSNTVPSQICHEWNTVAHRADYEGRPGRRALTYYEVQALFDAADARVEEIRSQCRKGEIGFHWGYSRFMRRPPTSRTAAVGLTRVQLAVQEVLGWVFREQPLEDFGIDAHVEIAEEGKVAGKLLAFQIKSGNSYFDEDGPSGWWYRPNVEHVRYWINHSLPVVVVLVHPETKLCHWQLVSSRTLIETRNRSWKLLVPKSNLLDETAVQPLLDATDGDPYVLRLRELQLSIPWMRMLAKGARLIIDVEEWVNKTSGRGFVSLSVDEPNGDNLVRVAHWGVYLGGRGYAEVVPHMFRWADITLHLETYGRESFNLASGIEVDGHQLVMLANGDWCAIDEVPPLRPYKNVAGEVDCYRFELKLNDLGRSFLLVDEFARTGDRQLTPR